MFVRIWLKGTHWNITIRHAITNRPSKAASLDLRKIPKRAVYSVERERERDGWEREKEKIHTNQNLLCLDCIHGIHINYIYQKLISYDFTPIVLIERGLKTT